MLALSENGRFNRVLVATDGSNFSTGAIRTGVALARRHSAHLIGLSVAVYNPEYSSLVPNLEEEAKKCAREALKSFSAEAGSDAQTVTIEAADPHQGILAAAKAQNANVIVIGRRGKRGLARMMVGDATTKVIGHADGPVLVVPRAARLWEKRILLATDGSCHSEAAADTVSDLAQWASLPVTVVSVVTSSHSKARRQEAEQAVAADVVRLGGLGVKADGKVVEGRPDEAIVKVAEEVGADLIVMGSHGRTGMVKVLLGSITERVIGQAVCPVLVVRA